MHAAKQGRIQRWGWRGSSPPTTATTMELLLIFIGMKEIEEEL
jgi:hypothetical protein